MPPPGCIQLVRFVPPIAGEHQQLRCTAQLEINPEAQKIISERFKAPISVIVYVGKMGVGKSKLATTTVAVLEKELHKGNSSCFRSGAGAKGVTQGVWMWPEPLQHPDDNDQIKGSILVLDCEPVDNLDENTATHLYFFCMMISTAFVVVLRPSHLDRFQYNVLYHALQQCEVNKSSNVLPTVWLLPLDQPEFLYFNSDTGDEIEVSKEDWLHHMLHIADDHNTDSQCDYITRMLPKIDAFNIHHLPELLKINTQTLDAYSLLQKEESAEYFKSVTNAIKAFLDSGPKRSVDDKDGNSFMQPDTLANFIGDLISCINQYTLSKANESIEQDLLKTLDATFEKETLARFQEDILQHAKSLIFKTKQNLEVKMDELLQMNQKMKDYHSYLVRTNHNGMMGIINIPSSSEGQDEEEEKQAFLSLPQSIQDRFNTIEDQMKQCQEPIAIVEQTQGTMSEIWNRWVSEMQDLLQEVFTKLNAKNDLQIELVEVSRDEQSSSEAHCQSHTFDENLENVDDTFSQGNQKSLKQIKHIEGEMNTKELTKDPNRSDQKQQRLDRVSKIIQSVNTLQEKVKHLQEVTNEISDSLGCLNDELHHNISDVEDEDAT